ncbi:hypothetical protein NM688_g980 [Phlebia brevispora]|uniref:Uncharacterized protein n=1 Tax=Phlebia brevispora TaxID=194682 RepID=A0ACC1TD10_9APHY|nr:hypothetical protein NM688_g980 [Phlebia brevispora]
MRQDSTILSAREPYADEDNRTLEYHVASSIDVVDSGAAPSVLSKALSSPTSWQDVAQIRCGAFDCHVACRLGQYIHVSRQDHNTKQPGPEPSNVGNKQPGEEVVGDMEVAGCLEDDIRMTKANR